MLSVACREVGQNCDCIVSGDTEEELMKNAAEHAVKDHGYKQEDIMTPEMQEMIKSHMRRVLTFSLHRIYTTAINFFLALK